MVFGEAEVPIPVEGPIRGPPGAIWGPFAFGCISWAGIQFFLGLETRDAKCDQYRPKLFAKNKANGMSSVELPSI